MSTTVLLFTSTKNNKLYVQNGLNYLHTLEHTVVEMEMLANYQLGNQKTLVFLSDVSPW